MSSTTSSTTGMSAKVAVSEHGSQVVRPTDPEAYMTSSSKANSRVGSRLDARSDKSGRSRGQSGRRTPTSRWSSRTGLSEDGPTTVKEAKERRLAGIAQKDALIDLRQAGYVDLCTCDSQGRFAAHLIIFRRDLELTKALVAARAPLDVQDALGRTPLHYAAAYGDVPIVRELLKAHVAPDVQDLEGETPLLCAIEAGHEQIAKFLIRAGASPKATDSHGRSLLVRAARSGAAAFIDLLSSSAVLGAPEIDEVDKDGWTPLHHAALFDRGPAVAALLRRDADEIRPTADGFWTPLTLATEFKRKCIAELDNAEIRRKLRKRMKRMKKPV